MNEQQSAKNIIQVRCASGSCLLVGHCFGVVSACTAGAARSSRRIIAFQIRVGARDTALQRPVGMRIQACVCVWGASLTLVDTTLVHPRQHVCNVSSRVGSDLRCVQQYSTELLYRLIMLPLVQKIGHHLVLDTTDVMETKLSPQPKSIVIILSHVRPNERQGVLQIKVVCTTPLHVVHTEVTNWTCRLECNMIAADISPLVVEDMELVLDRLQSMSDTRTQIKTKVYTGNSTPGIYS